MTRLPPTLLPNSPVSGNPLDSSTGGPVGRPLEGFAPNTSSLTDSRIVRLLTDMAVSDAVVSHQSFVGSLGNFIDFSGSVALSLAHEKLPNTVFQPGESSEEAIKDNFLQVRRSIVKAIIQSFIPSEDYLRLKLPSPDIALNAEGEYATPINVELYHRFYLSHQREMDFRIQNLLLDVRASVSGISLELAQLCALDETLNSTLSTHIKRLYGVIPKLLEKRFNILLSDSRMPSEKRLGQFCHELQSLLLAELELRLLPTLGLIDALSE